MPSKAAYSGIARKALFRVSETVLYLTRDTALFGTETKRKRNRSVVLAQDMLTGTWEEELSATISRDAGRHADHEIFIVDLSGLEQGDPHQLARGVRLAIRDEIKRRAIRPMRPRPVLRWVYKNPREVPLRTAFTLAWEAMDRDEPVSRVAVPWLTERGSGVLAYLPPSLSVRTGALRKNRLLTFHALAVQSRVRGRTSLSAEKACLRFLRRFQELGLIVDRGFARGMDEVELGIVDEVRERGRVKIYESMVAALEGIEPPTSHSQAASQV